MDPETEKIIKEQIDKLPVEVKKIFADPGLGDKIINIGKKNGLNVEQLGTLQVETNLVMLGLVHPDEFQDEIKKQLNINELKANNITIDVNREILSGILEKLKEVYEQADENLPDEEDNVKIKKTEEIKNAGTDWNIMKSAGIEILNGNGYGKEQKETLPVPEKLELDSPLEEHPLGGGGQIIHPGTSATPQEGNKHPILAQKLSGPVQTPVVKTEHTLENITKNSDTTTPPQSNSKKYEIDPYREKPE